MRLELLTMKLRILIFWCIVYMHIIDMKKNITMVVLFDKKNC